MRTKHYLRIAIAAMAITLSLPVSAQTFHMNFNSSAMPKVIDIVKQMKVTESKTTNGKFVVDEPSSRHYISKRMGNAITYAPKTEYIKSLQSKTLQLSERDSVTVTCIFTYDHDKAFLPNVTFYNVKGDFISSREMGLDGDTMMMRVPVDTFDIENAVWKEDGNNLSFVIKELVPIAHDTTIVLDQAEATEVIPVFAYDENGTKLEPSVFENFYSENQNIIRKGNISTSSNTLQCVYLKGYGVVHQIYSYSVWDDATLEDSISWNQGQLYTYYINKLSDRYSLITIPFLIYNDSELYLARLRSNSSNEGFLANDPKDCIVYEETFQPTPLGENSVKHSVGYDMHIMKDGINEDEYYMNIEGLTDNGSSVKLHLCAPKEYGVRSDAYDLGINLAYGDKQNMTVQTWQDEDDDGNPVSVIDTSFNYSYLYGESFMQKEDGSSVEYFDNGHSVFGNFAFQVSPGTEDITEYREYPGHKAFSAPADKRTGVYGNSVPMFSMLSQNTYNEYMQSNLSFWKPCYIGRLGEVRGTDNDFSHLLVLYNDSVVYETDTLNNVNNFTVQWAQSHHDVGEWKLTFTDDNVKVDDIVGRNIAEINYDQRRDDWTAPTLQIMNFVTADGTVTDRFASASEGILQLSGGDFNYVEEQDGFYYDCKPTTIKVEYSPYEEEAWSELTVDEDASLYTYPAFGYFWRGQLSQVRGNSSNGWFDLRVTLTDESGNTQVQTISPAFKIDALTAISTVVADKNSSNNATIYDLQGRVVSNPAHGIYIKNGKKFVVK